MDLVEAANGLLEQATVALLPMVLAIAGLALKVWIGTHSHRAALDAVTAALGRAAAIAARELDEGRAPDTAAAAKGMADYVGELLPATVAKLKPADGALERMATGVLLQLLQSRADPRASTP